MAENTYVGTVEERALMELHTEFYNYMLLLKEDIEKPFLEGPQITEIWKKIATLLDSIKSLSAIVYKQRGLTFINKFGTASYSYDDLEYMNSLYNKLRYVSKPTQTGVEPVGEPTQPKNKR